MAYSDRGRRRAWDGWERERSKKSRIRDGSSGGNVLPLAQAIEEWVKQANLGKRMQEADLFDRWEELVGAAVAEKATPLRLERGRLVLKVANSTWRHQLLFMRRELIATLNGHFGETFIKEIVMTG